jgi:hypothetical protein
MDDVPGFELKADVSADRHVNLVGRIKGSRGIGINIGDLPPSLLAVDLDGEISGLG